MNYSTTDPLIRDIVRLRFRQSADIAKEIGAPVLVLHSTGNRYEGKSAASLRGWLGRCEAFWAEFLPGVPSGVRIALENLDDDEPEIFLRQLEIVEKLGAGCCFDVGHAACNFAVPVSEWIRALGSRITHVHMHDNDRLRDRHWALGDGVLPIADIVGQLNDCVPKDTPCVLECDFTKSVRWLRDNGIRA